MKPNAYEVWILGYTPDGMADDYEELIATFPEEQKEAAIWFMNNYKFNFKKNTQAVLEYVQYYDDGSSGCIDVIMEVEN